MAAQSSFIALSIIYAINNTIMNMHSKFVLLKSSCCGSVYLFVSQSKLSVQLKLPMQMWLAKSADCLSLKIAAEAIVRRWPQLAFICLYQFWWPWLMFDIS